MLTGLSDEVTAHPIQRLSEEELLVRIRRSHSTKNSVEETPSVDRRNTLLESVRLYDESYFITIPKGRSFYTLNVRT
mgnify:CR=1 FL=1